MKTNVLFICSHNTSRSQIAEALLKKVGGDEFLVESAGIEAGELNPYAVEVLKEEGIDISKASTNKVIDFFKEGKHYHYVITVCDESKSEKCPIFPGLDSVLHWSLEDPAIFEGTQERKLEKFREIKKQLENNIIKFIDLVKNNHIKDGFPTSWHANS